MPAPRLVFVVAAVTGMLIAISLGVAREQRATDGNGTTTAVLPAPSVREPPRTVEAKLPHDGPVRAATGDQVVLRFTPKQSDVVVLDVFGVRENVRRAIPTVLRFKAVREGSFVLQLRAADKPLVRIDVQRPRPRSGGTPTAGADAPAPRKPEPADDAPVDAATRG